MWCYWGWIGRLKSTDSDQCLWDGNRIEYRFSLPKVEHLVDRRLVDGCLPIVETVWEHGGVRYTETAFVIPLAGVPAPGVRILAEDPLVMMVRIDMEAMRRASTLMRYTAISTGSWRWTGTSWSTRRKRRRSFAWSCPTRRR